MKSAKGSRPAAVPTAMLLKPCDPEALQWDMQQIQLGIARRAYELFETRNREHGHDWEDWFQAESELLRPVSIAVAETAERFSIRANVLGLSENEVKVSVEPTRVSIVGRRNWDAACAPEVPPADFFPDQVLRVIPLSSEVDPKGAIVELQSGVLKFELPKLARQDTMAATAATA